MRPAEPLAPWPIIKPITAAGKRAAELHATWAEQHERIAAVEAEFLDAQEALRAASAGLESVLYEAAQTGKRGKAVTDAEAAFTQAEQKANAPWAHRVEAPVRAAEDARDAYEVHISEYLDELLSEPELGDEAEEARDAVLAATQAQVEAFARLRRARTANEAIVKVADGINGRSIPTLDGAAREACLAAERILGDGLPAPRPDHRSLSDRRVLRGEARQVEVEVNGRKGAEVVPSP